jgi:hypothetical protein
VSDIIADIVRAMTSQLLAINDAAVDGQPLSDEVVVQLTELIDVADLLRRNAAQQSLADQLERGAAKLRRRILALQPGERLFDAPAELDLGERLDLYLQLLDVPKSATAFVPILSALAACERAIAHAAINATPHATARRFDPVRMNGVLTIQAL